MKYIIFGLGNFGASLAEKLTNLGNEVIGVDNNMAKIDALKEKISHTICLDATDQLTVSGLPLQETDVVIVAIGENQGANILVTALLKNLKVKRLISRAINPLHENVLQAIGVDEIVHPEEETAERWSNHLCLQGVLDSFEINNEFGVIKIVAPAIFHNKMLGQINFEKNHNLKVLTTIKTNKSKNLLGFGKEQRKVQGFVGPDLMVDEGDILVLYGASVDIEKFLKE
jgi:trk system potassium uptake protein